jgi:hypothetical protein
MSAGDIRPNPRFQVRIEPICAVPGGLSPIRQLLLGQRLGKGQSRLERSVPIGRIGFTNPVHLAV